MPIAFLLLGILSNISLVLADVGFGVWPPSIGPLTVERGDSVKFWYQVVILVYPPSEYWYVNVTSYMYDISPLIYIPPDPWVVNATKEGTFYPGWTLRYFEGTVLAPVDVPVGWYNSSQLVVRVMPIGGTVGLEWGWSIRIQVVDTKPPIINLISPSDITYVTNFIPLTFTVNEPTSWIGYSLDGQANVTITGNLTLTGLSDGPHSIRVYANDTVGNMGYSPLIFFSVQTISELNEPPVLDLIGDKTVDEGSPLTFTATAFDPNVPPQTLTFSLIGAPAGASIDPSTGEFTWTPTEAQGPGTHTFKVRVTDNGVPNLYDEEEITVTVNEVNEPPVLAAIGDKATPWGVELTFTAIATDPDIPANTLTFSLVDAPSDAKITSGGAFSWTPTSSQIGTHTFKVKVKDDGSPSLYDEEEITVTVEKRPTTLVYSGDSFGQYSDSVKVTATLTDASTGDPIEGKMITFTIGAQSKTVNTAAGTGIASTTITLTQPAGSYTVNSVFAGDSLYLPSSDSDSFTINKEKVDIEYAGNMYVITAGVSTAPVQLAAHLTQEDDDYPGNLALATVEFTLENQGTGPRYSISNVPVNSLGDALTTLNVQVGTYFVTVKVCDGNQYWTHTEVDQELLNVISGTGSQMVTGGGWIPDSDSVNGKGNFGFTVQYQKKGLPKGQFVYLLRGSDGYNYLIKSNSWEGGGLSFTGPNSAFFTGRCTIQKIDRATGEVVESWGNYRFTVEITDDGQSTPKADTFALKVWNPSTGAIWKQIGSYALGGGNILVYGK